MLIVIGQCHVEGIRSLFLEQLDAVVEDRTKLMRHLFPGPATSQRPQCRVASRCSCWPLCRETNHSFVDPCRKIARSLSFAVVATTRTPRFAICLRFVGFCRKLSSVFISSFPVVLSKKQLPTIPCTVTGAGDDGNVVAIGEGRMAQCSVAWKPFIAANLGNIPSAMPCSRYCGLNSSTHTTAVG